MRTFPVVLVVALALCAVASADFGGFTGAKYQAMKASDKANKIWNQVTKDSSQGNWPSTLSLAGIFVESMDTTMDTVSDELPFQYLGTTRREKLIHSVGAISRIRFTPVDGAGYTGIFSGSQFGFARCSLAKKYDGSQFTPGCGFKFLRDGVKSANFVAMYKLTGQTSTNFFKNDFVNHVPDLDDSAATAEKLLKKKFLTASQWPTMVGLSDLAAYDESGKKVSPKMPFSLTLKPVDAVRNKFGDNETNDHIKQLVSFGKKDAWSPLWEVYAAPKCGESAVKIGTIEMYDKFVTSKWADSEMFFQHQRIDDDIKLVPEWRTCPELQ